MDLQRPGRAKHWHNVVPEVHAFAQLSTKATCSLKWNQRRGGVDWITGRALWGRETLWDEALHQSQEMTDRAPRRYSVRDRAALDTRRVPNNASQAQINHWIWKDVSASISSPWINERVYLPFCEVADTPFHIQGDDIKWEIYQQTRHVETMLGRHVCHIAPTLTQRKIGWSQI